MGLEGLNKPIRNTIEAEPVDGRRHVLSMETINRATNEGNSIKVIVERSSGEREDGWYAAGSDGDVVSVYKGDGRGGVLHKEVSFDDLKEWNALFSKEQRRSIANLEDEIEGVPDTNIEIQPMPQAENYVDAENYGSPEKGEQLLEQDVASSSDFRDLIVNVIDRHDDWKYSDGEPMDKQQLKEIINSVRSGERGVESVTRRYGLRSKVTELLNQSITNIEETPKIESNEEDLTSPENQAKLAQEYLDAYADYRKIADRRLNDIRILDSLRDEAIAPDLITRQENLVASTHDAEELAMKKYVEIGEKLTEETKDEYLR